MSKYRWTAPSGIWEESCVPYRRDEWIRWGPVWYGVRSYWNWAMVISGYAAWAKKRKKARAGVYKRVPR